MIKKLKYNKILAFILLIITILGVAQPIFAASGTGSWICGQYASYIKTTDNSNSKNGVIIRKLVNHSTGDQKTVFCAEHGIDVDTGTIYNGSYYTPVDSSIRKACKIAYLGWYKDHGDYVVDGGISNDDKKQYVFTQQYIWEILGQSSARFIDTSIQAEYESFKTYIKNEIAGMENRPSFDGTTISVQAGENKVINDSNGVLSSYPSIDNTTNGIRVTHSKGSNSMTISVDENTNLENYTITDAEFKSWGMIKDGTQDNDTMVYFEFEDGVQNQLYSMAYNDPVTLSFSVSIENFGKLELSKSDINGELIDGAIFNIAGPDNYNKDVTVQNGKVTLDKLRKGTYIIKEISAPYGYLLDTNSYSVEVKANQIATQAIINTEPTGTISIIKKDSETGSVPQGDAVFYGAVYKVYAEEDIYNKARTKKLYSNGDLVATRTMNEQGKTEDITNLPLGKYVIKEEVASLGYMLDTKEYEVTLTYKDQNEKVISNTTTSLEKVEKMGVHIFKSGIKENSGETPGLEGAEFTIKLNSAVEKAYKQGYTYEEVWNGIDKNGNQVKVDSKRVAEAQIIAPTYEVIKTDKDGNAYTQKKLPYGKYIVKETKTPTDYESAVDFTFSITNDETQIKDIAKKTKHIVVNNEQLETYIKLIKKDQKTGKLVTLNSTTFEIKATKDIYDRATKKILFKKGETISQKVGNTTYTSFTTNADNIVVPDNSYNSENEKRAEVTTPLKLPVGSYEITEIKIPDGFLQLDKTITFDIENVKDYDTDQDGDFIKEIVVKNEQPTGTIKLDKTIAIRENVNTSLVDVSDLSDIEFKLSAKEDIIDKADGSIIYNKGQDIKTYNLSKDGKLTITDLPMGTYEIEETKTLNGLVLNKTKYEVKFKQKDLTTKVYDSKLDVKNDTTLVEFSKTDVTGDEELLGAKLTVLDSENNIIDTWTSTKETHKIEGLTVGEEYTLKEEIAPDGYVISNKVTFKVEDTNEIQKVNMKDKVVEILKENISGKKIEGAKLQVLNMEGNVIDEWISEKEPHKVKGLKENETYILHEELVVGNYVKASDIEFTVSNDKETQKVVMIDKLVEITKTDLTTGEELEGAELEVTDEEGNVIDKWTSTKEPHQVKGLEEGKTYLLKETTAPYGYEITEEIKFVVTTDKETQKVEMKDMPILKNVKIIKIDSETKEAIKDKFTFAIYEDTECTKLIKEAQSNKEDGTALFEELRYGSYYVKEIKAPNDYELSNRVVKVEINDKGIFIDDEQIEEKEGTVEFTFENKKIEVPNTGDGSNIKLFAGMVLISLLGITYIIIHKHKKNK